MAFLLVPVALLIAGCAARPYYFPANNFAGRPIPPSRLANRVMVAIGNAGAASGGALELLDASRDIRSNVFTPNSTFNISGYSGSGNPTLIFNYPEQLRGYIYDGSGAVNTINYGTESGVGSTLGGTPLPGVSSGLFVPADAAFVYSAEETTGLFVVSEINSATPGTYALPVSGVYRVAANPSHTVVLVLTRNSNNVYRLLRLNASQPPPPVYTVCEPVNNPVYCLVPVGSTQPDGTVREPAFHRPANAYFSPDGAQVYILSCGRECGGSAATGDDVPAISFANINNLRTDSYPTSATYTTPVVATTPLPGGATTAISDGTNAYVAGQQLLADGLFTGNLSVIPLSTKVLSATLPISDGMHTKMLFGDNNSLWIGSQDCANGERASKKQNSNCLTRYDVAKNTAAIVPSVDPANSKATVPFPNENLDPYYYGSLTGICYVQGFSKMYTAYGGQVHAFNTADGSEIDNSNITVQGLALDVAYLDATTNEIN